MNYKYFYRNAVKNESVCCGQSEDFAKSGAPEKYMDLSLHKITVDGEEISFVTKKR
ncbi:MAG TPA: hypothetical protein IAB11_06275 [Candidatus Ornithoclostridium faecavium]|nr:hypothetical protein [Candidatus Ornithoclostridium faecavium]